MTMHRAALAEIVRRDPRFAYQAYEFVLIDALSHTQEMVGCPRQKEGEEGHADVSGRQLLEGVCDLARREFGLMARTVFRLWGIERTGDIGTIVFNLVEWNLMSKTDRDSPSDFDDVFDLDEALVHQYRIQLDQAE